MPWMRRVEPVTSLGQRLLDSSVFAFETNRDCDVLLKSAEGHIFRAHQVVLAKSPTLQAAMKQPEVRYLPEILLIFPEYKKTSLAIFLQFLYTGEVDLVSHSDMLIEFQDLCQILKVNPQVYKRKHEPESDSIKISCPGCRDIFNKTSKLTFHRSYCNPGEGTSASVNFDETTRLDEEAPPQTLLNPEMPEKQPKIINDHDPSPVKDFLRDNFLDEHVPFATAEPSSTKISVNQNVLEDGTTPFKMPDNFDLPDEIIQEQLPSARSFTTSTPIRGYADPKKEFTDKKGTSKLKDKGITSKGISTNRKESPFAVGEASTASASKDVTKPHSSSKGKSESHHHEHKKSNSGHHNHRHHNAKKKHQQDGPDHDRPSSKKSHHQREVKHHHGGPEISHQEILAKKTKVAHGGIAASASGDVAAKSSSLKQAASATGFDDLAAKKRRMMLKLQEDEHVVKPRTNWEKRDEKRKRPRKSTSPQRIREKTSHHRKLKKEDKKSGKTHVCVSDCYVSSSDEVESNATTENEDEDRDTKTQPTKSRDQRYTTELSTPNSKKIFVSFQPNGKEQFIELYNYRLTLSKSSTDSNSISAGGKIRVLEKVGKRIRKIVSTSDSESSEVEDKRKEKLSKDKEPKQEKFPSASNLPRIPKLKKPDEIAQSDEKKEANKVNPTPVASTNWQFP